MVGDCQSKEKILSTTDNSRVVEGYPQETHQGKQYSKIGLMWQ